MGDDTMYFVTYQSSDNPSKSNSTVLRESEMTKIRKTKMAKGGMLKEDDFVWNAVGKKLIVDKVTDDEYYLTSFGQPSSSPFGKQKVDSYIISGEWSLTAPKAKYSKMAKGGMAEHGLKRGDTITDDMSWEDSIVVKNEKSGTRAKVNLNTGERKEAKMAYGGKMKYNRKK